MKNYEAIKYLVINELAKDNRDELAFALIDALTYEFTLADLLDLMEEATDLLCLYEATGAYRKDRQGKLDKEEITHESTLKMWEAERQELEDLYRRTR